VFIAMSEEIGEISAALAAAQADVESALKNQKNSHFRSSYADLSAVLDVAKPALAKHGLAVVAMPGFDAEASVATMDMVVMLSGSDQRIAYRASIPIAKTDAHGVASGWTYLRRYCMSGALNLSVDEDDDGNAAVAKSSPTKKASASKPKRKAKTSFKKTSKQDDAKALEAVLSKLKNAIEAAESAGTADTKAIELAKGVVKRKGASDDDRTPLEFTTAALTYLENQMSEVVN